MADTKVEHFAPGGGRAIAVVGLVVVAGITVVGIIDPQGMPLAVVATALALGVLLYASTLRPRVTVEDDSVLVLRNMIETIRIPLAAIDEVTVRQVLVVSVGEKRYVSPGVGRSMRQALKSGRTDSGPRYTAPALGPALGADAPSDVEGGGMQYADFVEFRLQDLIEEDRKRRGVRRYSEEVEALGAEVERDPAWPEIVALAVTTSLMVFAIVS